MRSRFLLERAGWDQAYWREVRRLTARYRTSRRFDYRRSLLPSRYLAELEPDDVRDPQRALEMSGLSMGYPAWNLLYFSLLCTLPPRPDSFGPEPAQLLDDIVIAETGTNQGTSTIVMAQVLKDANLDAVVRTVDRDPAVVDNAREHVRSAGLSEHVEFNVGDSLAFLETLVDQHGHLDFVFLDDRHNRDHVVREFEIIYPAVSSRRGTVYIDNTLRHGVAEALESIRRRFGGNLVEFPNCSWAPPGNAIWQPQ
jgi:hypothetical protein